MKNLSNCELLSFHLVVEGWTTEGNCRGFKVLSHSDVLRSIHKKNFLCKGMGWILVKVFHWFTAPFWTIVFLPAYFTIPLGLINMGSPKSTTSFMVTHLAGRCGFLL